MLCIYKNRSLLKDGYTVMFGARVFDENSDISEIMNALLEEDLFGGDIAFDIELDLAKCVDNGELLEVLEKTPHNVWWYSSKKPTIKVNHVWLEEGKQKPSFNIFEMVDLLVARDKKNAWMFYHKHLTKEDLQEIIPGILWGFKTLAQVVAGETTGISPFVVNKMKKVSQKWTLQEVLQKHYELLDIYEGEIEGAKTHQDLEKFILSI